MKVMSGQSGERTDVGCEWREVVSGQRWEADRGGGWTEVTSGQIIKTIFH